jgi:nicotinamidase-related amidase
MFYDAEARDVFSGTFDGERIMVKRSVTPDYQLAGTWQVDFVEELKECIDPKDVIVNKHTSIALESTPLERYLIQLGIKTLLLCGFITDYCVEGTSRTARDRGYMTVLVGDACAARCAEDQKSALERHKWIMGPVVTSAELSRILASE